MAEIRPFRGVHYNESLVKDLSKVICPVYDIIAPQQHQELYLRSEYNFIRLEFGRELPQDTASDNRYTRSAGTLEQWLRDGVLEIDETPAFYLHDQYFTYHGKEYKRRGIVARVRLEEWDKRIIRPHEGTMTEPKSDRLSLLWALQANTSPILTLFEDKRRQISSLLAAQEQSRPEISVRTVDGESHNVWAITAPAVTDQITSCFAEEPLYIADGHHRYESALAYQQERIACSADASRDEAFNFVMMTLVDFADPGLLILPPHRLVRGISQPTLRGLMARLKVFFHLEALPVSASGGWARVDNLLEATNEMRLLLFGLEPGNLFVLRLRDPTAASQMMPYFHSDLYKRLNVSIVDHVILEKLLALSSDREKVSLAYTHDRLEAVNRVLSQEYQLAFLLSPVKAEVVKAIADAGDKMPRKSTYFYPKLPAGLILNRLL